MTAAGVCLVIKACLVFLADEGCMLQCHSDLTQIPAAAKPMAISF